MNGQEILTGSLIGALLGLLITEHYERIWKRPTFKINVGDISDGKTHRFLHINVTNVERKGIRKLLRSNNSSELVKARIVFYDPLTRSELCNFIGRWSSKAEPLDDVDYSSGTGKPNFAMAQEAEHEIILPGETKPLTVSVKFNGNSSFYGFNNWSYFKEWKDPQLEIDLKSVVVKFELYTTKFKRVAYFALNNPSDNCNNFNLSPLASNPLKD